jgi:hypothetical protein
MGKSSSKGVEQQMVKNRPQAMKMLNLVNS